LGNHAVEIGLDGVLDKGAVPVVADLCRNYLASGQRVVLNLEGLLHISREGRNFLYVIKHRVSVVNPPEFVELGQSLAKAWEDIQPGGEPERLYWGASFPRTRDAEASPKSAADKEAESWRRTMK